MEKDFKFKMKHKFPLLYRDVGGDIRQTSMVFGFDVGDGWTKLIEDLSDKLEPKIKKIKEDIEKSPNLKCENCGHSKSWHWWFVLVGYLRKWFYILIHWLPSIPKNYQIEKSKLKRLGAYGFKFKWTRILQKPHKNILCTGFRVPHPCASQVKEKLGGMRFYLTYYNEELESIISEAQKKSYTICECCGAEGKLTYDGWCKTLCDKCSKERK
jgi:hypothetical protein